MEGLMRPASARHRLPGWPERLAAIVDAHRDTPFCWGGHDCCLFAATVVDALTGHDPAAAYRGTYATEAEAEALIGQRGLPAFLAEQAAAAGLPQLAHPSLAHRGDLALVMVGNTPLLGVVLDDLVAAPATDGLAFVPASSATMAWGV
jgi:hypothetical protein